MQNLALHKALGVVFAQQHAVGWRWKYVVFDEL
jgi:hypothetical protein